MKKNIAYDLGEFTWVNELEPKSQRGWLLDEETRTKVSNGSIKFFVLALCAEDIERVGILGGIDIILNYDIHGQKHHENAFSWNWNSITKTGGWITYNDLLKEKCVTLDSGIIYLRYDITSNPYYNIFKNVMNSADWGIFAIQRWCEIDTLPILKAYFH
ncbi:MAG: hypothetical protein FWD47_02740 [Treponema sp.]|nr:hypothetical protein [Treponema sp.]